MTETLVDQQDAAALDGHVWRLNPAGYVYRTIWAAGRTGKVYMHRQIMGAPQGLDVDHLNGNKLDNRRGNLRLCTRGQNNAAGKKRKGSMSKYRGVTFSNYRTHHRKPWVAQIGFNGKTIRIGRFATEIEAARAYDKKAIELYKEFANPNFPGAC